MKRMKSPYEDAYKEYSPDAFRRRLEKQRKKKINASGITADESKDDRGNSRLSSSRRG